ncbi:hypothetical protein lerEdw1_007478 [Lerista edwardsae]|nr:hypothetical protein lerEdw1_007478 [Lerista edwardsae]
MARCNPGSWRHLFCWFIVLCKGIRCIDHVPMLIWTSDRSLQGLANTLHEGEVISKHELQKFLPRSEAPRNVVLFLQDTLSVDDFTRYADSSGNETPFRNVQASITVPDGVSQQFSKTTPK